MIGTRKFSKVDHTLNTDEQLINTILSIPLTNYRVLTSGNLNQVAEGVLQYANADNNSVTFTIKYNDLDNFETM